MLLLGVLLVLGCVMWVGGLLYVVTEDRYVVIVGCVSMLGAGLVGFSIGSLGLRLF